MVFRNSTERHPDSKPKISKDMEVAEKCSSKTNEGFKGSKKEDDATSSKPAANSRDVGNQMSGEADVKLRGEGILNNFEW